ncbi:unnamed protein product [Moneuplotes crassus]|uniref:EamA domain-containing protein n=1 Tax=Euplotes crassus TaxID=5936 RepID=A0AAD1XL00_EUPCR|nr:unnamed protein product [Moneuplotes crassus]
MSVKKDIEVSKGTARTLSEYSPQVKFQKFEDSNEAGTIKELTKESEEKNNTWKKIMLGYSLMFISMFGIAIIHICEKMAFFHNPNLGIMDGVLILGLTTLPIGFIGNKIKGNTVSIFKYDWKVQILMMIATICSCCGHFVVMWSLSLISVGKATLVFNLHPLFCIFIAYIFLREKVDFLSILFSLLALFGIYFLTINETGHDGKPNSNATFGLMLVFISAWNEAGIIISQRVLALYGVDAILYPFYSSLGLTLFGFGGYIFYPQKMLFPYYSLYDLAFLSMVGIGLIANQSFAGCALEYQSSSRLAPLNYLENVFTLLSDVFIFGYMFFYTDYIGISIITICLCTPALVKLFSKDS